MKKHGQDIIGTFIGGATGWITSGMYHDWIQPMMLAAVCSLIGLLITHFGRKILNSWDYNRKLPRFKKNGHK